MTAAAHDPEPQEWLRREVGLFGAVMMGLGSIIGTGLFVSVGIAAGIAGPAVLAAIAAAAVLATFNGLNSAQLAANHPVSGGTYEYAYKYLNGPLGFGAGWMFLCAKVASAATAAHGFAGYTLAVARVEGQSGRIPLGIAVVVILTALVLGGMRRSSHVNVAILSVTLLSLAAFCLAGVPTASASGTANLMPFFQPAPGETPTTALLRATALMFVAYTGYGRIATLGEEVVDPRRTIPRAVVLALVISALLYLGAAAIAIGAVGVDALSESTSSSAAPLAMVSRRFDVPGLPSLISIGAIAAMLGVLLNLILGLSRVVLAMARRGDLPPALARLNRRQTSPSLAVLLAGAAIVLLVCLGNVKATWSFSAFTVLIYYAITNLAALRLARSERLFSPIYAYGGLAACLFLAFWVERSVWIAGLAVLGAGFAWRAALRRFQRPRLQA
jgi:APA family basic amino acid/polyamine antiporter